MITIATPITITPAITDTSIIHHRLQPDESTVKKPERVPPVTTFSVDNFLQLDPETRDDTLTAPRSVQFVLVPLPLKVINV